MTFHAALAALKGVGAVSDEEMADWTNRMLVALGEEPLEALPPGTVRLINFGGKARVSPGSPGGFHFPWVDPSRSAPIVLWRTAAESRFSGWSSIATRFR